jgi:hypothetical protein
MAALSPYATTGIRLVERGYVALPVIPNTKRPGHLLGGEWVGLSDWRERWAHRPPSRFETGLWSIAPDAGVCVVTGEASHGLTGIDIDTEDAVIRAAIMQAIPGSSVRKVGAKGETLFYHSELKKSASFNVNGKRVLDIIGPGRQTVLPPSIHPDTGCPYRWSGEEALEDTNINELPELPDNVVERIAAALLPLQTEDDLAAGRGRGGQGNGAGSGNGSGGDDGSLDLDELAAKPHRLLNQAALQHLDMWVPGLRLYRCRRTVHGYEAVPDWRPSSTGQMLEKRKRNLKIASEGIRDFGADQGYTAIDLVMAHGACDLDTAFSFLSKALSWGGHDIHLEPRTVVGAELGTSPVTAPEPVTVPAEPVEGLDEGEGNEDRAPEKPEEDQTLLSLTHVPGVLGDVIDWVTETARRPNRIVGLGVALSVLGTLVGRRVSGPTRSGTHLYVLTLGPTGIGKQHAIDCSYRLMKAAGAGAHYGPSQFLSMSALINHIMDMPLSLCVQDEFGAFLKRINAKRASGHEASVSQIMRMAWGTSFGAMTTPEWAGRKSEVLHAIAMTLHGLSTHGEFYDALQQSDLGNGFLNRFLVLSSSVRTAPEVPRKPVDQVPVEIEADLQRLYRWDGSQLGTARLNDSKCEPVPERLHWQNIEVEQAFQALSLEVDQLIDRYDSLEFYVARTAEIALRLATIRAIGRAGRGAMLEAADLAWGKALALHCGKKLAEQCKVYMAENETQQWHNRILRFIQRKRQVKVQDIQRSIGGALRSKDFHDVLHSLAEMGLVEPMVETNPAGRRRITGYKIRPLRVVN